MAVTGFIHFLLGGSSHDYCSHDFYSPNAPSHFSWYCSGYMGTGECPLSYRPTHFTLLGAPTVHMSNTFYSHSAIICSWCLASVHFSFSCFSLQYPFIKASAFHKLSAESSAKSHYSSVKDFFTE